jgi:inhibitor of KinA
VNPFRIVAAGDSALVVEFEERIDPEVNARAVALAERLHADPVAGVRDVVPTYRSVAVYFDPLRTAHDALMARLERDGAAPMPLRRAVADVVRLPVCYGGEFGPDLGAVAAFGGISEPAVVDLHTKPAYHVFMLGFAPGLAYLGVVDERIAAPRRDTPRVRVPRGSVGIAGAQTGVYPSETPGGWQIIGRTPLLPFDLSRADPFLLKAGDTVRFDAIDRAEFDRLEQGAG